MSKLSTGVFIGKNYISAVTLSGAANSPEVLDVATEKIKRSNDPSAAYLEDENKLVLNTLRAAMNKLKVRSDEIFLSLPETGIMLRHFDMPLLPRSEQTQAIKFEARKYIPFKIEEVFSDYKIIYEDRKRKTMRILFIAVKKSDVQMRLDMFSNIQMDISGIEISPVAVLKSLNIRKDIAKDETAAFLQISTEENIASISIIEYNYPTLSRDVPILSANAEDAHEKIINDLRISIDYYKRKIQDGKISKIILCGKNKLDVLAKSVNDEFKVEAVLKDLSNGIGKSQFNFMGEAIAAGAAMSGLGKDEYGINLLQHKTRTGEARIVAKIGSFLAIPIIFILLTSSYAMKNVIPVKNSLERVMQEAQSLPASTAGMSTQQLTELKIYTQKINAHIKDLYANRIYLTNKLDKISKSTTQGLWVDSFKADNLKDGQVTMHITGTVFSENPEYQIEIANSFLSSLKTNPEFMQGVGYCEFNNVSNETVKGLELKDEYQVTKYSIQCATRK